jgi:hypothetical protein
MMCKKVMNIGLIHTGTSKEIYIQPYFIRSLALSTRRSQQRVDHRHWSRRVTADNPHGFADKVLVRLRAIEDPAEREKEEKKALDQRRKSEKRRSNAETLARIRDQVNERNRRLKVNAGYVMLVAMQLDNLIYSDCMLILSPFTATACSHACLITGVSLYLTTTRVDTVRSRCRRLLMRIRW